MPRNGAGAFTLPPGSSATDGDTLTSTKWNTAFNDLEQDANAARPISAGGTGATSASGARAALGLGSAATDNASETAIAFSLVKRDVNGYAFAAKFRTEGGNQFVPSYSFLSDADSGFYSPADAEVGLALNTVNAYRFIRGTAAPASNVALNRGIGDARYQQTSSTRRFKEQERIAGPRDLSGIRAKSWVWGGDLPADDPRRGKPGYGIVAEDVEAIFPEAIRRDPQGRVEGIDGFVFIGAAIETLRALRLTVEALEARLAALEGARA